MRTAADDVSMIRRRATVVCVATLLASALAQAQVFEYNVQAYAPLPLFAGTDVQYKWRPRGLLPDNSIVANVEFFRPEAPGLIDGAAFVLGPQSASAITSPTGSTLRSLWTTAVETSGRVHLTSEDRNGSLQFYIWQGGVTSEQGNALLAPSFQVYDASTAGHLLGRSIGAPFGSEVIFNGTRRSITTGTDPFTHESAFSVNALGDVAGLRSFNTDLVAYVWSPSGNRTLSYPAIDPQWFLRIYTGVEINDLGWVTAMRSLTDQVTYNSFTYLWRGDERIELPGGGTDFLTPQLDNLGTLLSADDTSPYLWRDGELVRMTDLAISGFTGTLLSLDRLEPDGRVIGQALVDGQRVPVVLTPVPGPGSTALVSIGLLLAARRERRYRMPETPRFRLSIS